ncbi:hypothetical protein M514_00782 [Trichuris suis]|uniref:Uncharacterized protein n=1 Tax=Trichuris suis TaxID=68888 RepID=A0A085MMW0_9BILA|nr:hypothetical protein M513_00782 [Trichuris suis]KFD66069.1 hypothetical protein M514_00782 [Trichuris suis]
MLATMRLAATEKLLLQFKDRAFNNDRRMQTSPFPANSWFHECGGGQNPESRNPEGSKSRMGQNPEGWKSRIGRKCTVKLQLQLCTGIF